MIEIYIKADKGKIVTKYNAKQTTLHENSLVVRELERIKNDLMSLDYELDYSETHNDEE